MRKRMTMSAEDALDLHGHLVAELERPEEPRVRRDAEVRLAQLVAAGEATVVADADGEVRRAGDVADTQRALEAQGVAVGVHRGRAVGDAGPAQDLAVDVAPDVAAIAVRQRSDTACARAHLQRPAVRRD